MNLGVLGQLEMRDGDDVVDVGSRQQRLVLASLIAASGRPVTADALVEAIWGPGPPMSALGTLQSYISRLRKLLHVADDGPRLSFDGSGYRLDVDPAAVDFRRFEHLATVGRAHLEAHRPHEAAAVLAEALGLWRGPAFGELADHEAFAGLATRLEQRRLAAIEDRIEAELQLGRHAALVGELTELVAQQPLREGLRAQLALALYRAGRQADALAALADARRTLRDELGVDPGRPLRDLEAAILKHDPALESPAGVSPTTPPPAPAGEPGSAGLVGRDPELAVLLGALDEAASQARVLVVEGDPGIGKTRLVEELRLAARARGSTAVWGRSDESGAAPALWPWLPILRALPPRDGAAEFAVDDLLGGDAMLLAGRGAAVRFERFEAIARHVEAAGHDAPVVALLDDLQWADETSLDLLSFLAGRLQRGVLVVVTVRTLAIGRADAVTETLGVIARHPGNRRVQLRGLSEADTSAMLEAADLVDPASSRSARVHARAEGNPFYALELARLLDGEALDGSEVPSTVRDVIRRRLTRLPDTTQELLSVAAVTGRDVDVHLLSRAAGLAPDECLERIEPAVVDRWLVETPDRPGVLSFGHALVREVLLDGLTSLRRARLHLDVADAIEAAGAGQDDAEIVADHLWRAAPIGVGRRAAEALERAAEVALHRVSWAAAEDLLVRAVQLRRATVTSDEDLRAELSTLARLLEVMQATRYFQGADRAALARAQELAARFGADDLAHKLDWFQWAALSTAAQVGEAATLAQQFLDRAVAGGDPAARCTGLGMLGTSCWQQGRYREAVEHLDASAALFDELGPPTDGFEYEQRAVISSFRFINHAFHGDWQPEQAFAGFTAMTEALPPVAVPSICCLAASMAACLGHWDHVDAYVHRAFTADPSSQFAFWGGQLLMLRGMGEVRAGRAAEGLASFAEGEARYLSIGARTSLQNFQACMALLLSLHGHGQDAARLAAAARSRTGDEAWAEVMVLIAEAAAAHADGDSHSATSLLASALAVGTAQGAHGLVRRTEAVAGELGVELPGQRAG